MICQKSCQWKVCRNSLLSISLIFCVSLIVNIAGYEISSDIGSHTGSRGHHHYMTLRYTFTTIGSGPFSECNGFVRGWIIRKLFLEIRERFSPDLLPLSCSDQCEVATLRKSR